MSLELEPPSSTNFSNCSAYNSIPLDYSSPKWTTWSPGYQGILANFSVSCLTGKLQQLPIYGQTGPPTWCPSCGDQVECILSKVALHTQANFASSQVILGLAPTLIATLAPSVGEVGLLSANRPLLGLLLSLASPSVFCFRTLTFDDPMAILTGSEAHTPFTLRPSRWGRKGAMALSLFEYLLVCGAVANVVQTSIALSQWSIVSWKCNISYLPLTWPFGTVLVHILASSAFLLSNTMDAIRTSEATLRATEGWRLTILRWARREFTPCISHPKRGHLRHYQQKEKWGVVLLNMFAQAVTFVFLFYGTFLLSSLMFMYTADAVFVVARYLISTIVCRLILTVELGGMVAVEKG